MTLRLKDNDLLKTIALPAAASSSVNSAGIDTGSRTADGEHVAG